MHIINTFFEKVYCINLVNETERRKRCQDRFDKLGINVEFFNAVRYPFLDDIVSLFQFHGTIENKEFKYGAEFGCTLSHYNCIKLAKSYGYKNVLIFEDDVVFLNNFNEIIESYLEKLPKNWDMLYLYSGIYRWHNGHIGLPNSDKKLFKSVDVNGGVSYAVNSKFYDIILNELDSNFQVYDNLYSRRLQRRGYNIYSTFPNLCAQEVNRSTIDPTSNNLRNIFNLAGFCGKKESDYF